MAIFSVSNFL